jgi:two-component system LytT family sensor kinase
MMPRFFLYRLDHLLFWTLTVFFHGYTRLPWINKAGFGQFVLELIIRNGLLACAIYLTILYSIPQFTKSKQASGILGIVVALAIYVLGKNAHDVYFYGYVVGDPERQHFFYNTFYNLSIVIFYLAFATTLYLSKQWYLQREKMRQIEVEKLNTELEYLRAQVNPHFLFNAINTIYFQIDKQNTVARETLEKFSEMLRYQLYECNEASIEIEKEINYLHNYINLQKLRMGERYDVQFLPASALKGFHIPPLLLMPFVENTFKHVSHFTDRPNQIRIELSYTDETLSFRTFNSKENNSFQTDGGIGLKNVSRRLELLYGKSYSLQIDDELSTHSVTLQIPIA